MKPYVIYGLFLLVLILNACGGSASQPAQPAAAQPAPQIRAETPNQAALLALQEQFNLKPEQIKVVSVDKGEWPDTCLGLPQPGESCVQTITSGHIVTLEAEGKLYTYNVGQNLTVVRLAFIAD